MLLRTRKALLGVVIAIPLLAADCELTKKYPEDKGDAANCLKRASDQYDQCIAGGNTQSACGLRRRNMENSCTGPM